MAYISFQPSDYFNTKLWTGNSSTQSITGNNFIADLTWSKTRSNAESHILMDTVRDAGTTLNQQIKSDSASAEGDLGSSSTLTVNSTGFDLSGTTGGPLNFNGYTYVTWLWRAGGHTGSSNTDGSITSTVSANTTSGFSIVSYTGNGTLGATVGHGLGQTPGVFLTKRLSGTSSWGMYHQSTGAGGFMEFNGTSGLQSNVAYFNNTAPTSSVFSIGTDAVNNTSGSTYIAYCFAEKKGFSKFGSYVGNGNADGTFIYTGFKPAFLLYKCSSDNFTNWQVFDNKRSTYNLAVNRLNPNDSSVELSTTADSFDLLSNGFKARGTASNSNNSGSTFIYMAFSEESIVSSNGVPAVAR